MYKIKWYSLLILCSFILSCILISFTIKSIHSMDSYKSYNIIERRKYLQSIRNKDKNKNAVYSEIIKVFKPETCFNIEKIDELPQNTKVLNISVKFSGDYIDFAKQLDIMKSSPYFDKVEGITVTKLKDKKFEANASIDFFKNKS